MAEITLSGPGSTELGSIEVTSSPGPGPLERLVSELLSDFGIEPEAGA
jgi:hypothetical protein